MIGDVDKAVVCCVGCYYEQSDVTFRQITLALVLWRKMVFHRYINVENARLPPPPIRLDKQFAGRGSLRLGLQ